jgi:hypothetical protein
MTVEDTTSSALDVQLLKEAIMMHLEYIIAKIELEKEIEKIEGDEE